MLFVGFGWLETQQLNISKKRLCLLIAANLVAKYKENKNDNIHKNEGQDIRWSDE